MTRKERSFGRLEISRAVLSSRQWIGSELVERGRAWSGECLGRRNAAIERVRATARSGADRARTGVCNRGCSTMRIRLKSVPGRSVLAIGLFCLALSAGCGEILGVEPIVVFDLGPDGGASEAAADVASQRQDAVPRRVRRDLRDLVGVRRHERLPGRGDLLSQDDDLRRDGRCPRERDLRGELSIVRGRRRTRFGGVRSGSARRLPVRIRVHANVVVRARRVRGLLHAHELGVWPSRVIEDARSRR